MINQNREENDRTSSTAAGLVCASCGQAVAEQDAFTLIGAPYCVACKPLLLRELVEGNPIGAELTRRTYINHESSVKSIGCLHYIGGGFLLFVGGLWDFAASYLPPTAPFAQIIHILGTTCLVLAVGYLFAGSGLRRLRPWARVLVAILSGLGLLYSFPIVSTGIKMPPIGCVASIVINGYFLYLVFSQRGKMVFSREYKEVIRQTPHIKSKTSIVVWIVPVLFLLLFIRAYLLNLPK